MTKKQSPSAVDEMSAHDDEAKAKVKVKAKAKEGVHGRGDDVPIVGIGASAGGLEALEIFLSHLPNNPGMAFAIVQHLDPTHKGIMPELLQRATPLKVVQVKTEQGSKRTMSM